MSLTPDRKALLKSRVAPLPGPPPIPKPKVVVRDDAGVRDAEVSVSRADPNSNGKAAVVEGKAEPPKFLKTELKQGNGKGPGGVEYVTINMAAYETQREVDAWARAADRAHRQACDPFNYGHWGPFE